MTPSPDHLIQELQASRPAAPAVLRARVRETARAPRPASPWRTPPSSGGSAVVAVPAALALALVSAGAIGLALRRRAGRLLGCREAGGGCDAERREGDAGCGRF